MRLRQLQALPLRLKIPLTQQRIRDWYDHWNGQVYVSFSGGKDSTVLKHIVDSMYSDVPAVFVNTGLEYPEIQRFVREVKAGKYDCFNPDVEILRPEMRFDEVIRKYGYPVGSKRIASNRHGRRQAGGTGHRHQGGAGHGPGALWGRAGGIRGGDHPVEAGGDRAWMN